MKNETLIDASFAVLEKGRLRKHCRILEDQYAHIEVLFTDINMQALSMAFTLFVLFMSDGAHSADFDLRAAPPFRLSACEFAVSTEAYRGNVLITTLRDAAGCGLARRPPLPGGNSAQFAVLEGYWIRPLAEKL